MNGVHGGQTQFWKGTIPAKFGLIWFCGFRRKDLNVEVYDGCQAIVIFTWPLARWASKGYTGQSMKWLQHVDTGMLNTCILKARMDEYTLEHNYWGFKYNL